MFIQTVENLCNTSCPTPESHSFIFEPTPVAASHNKNILSIHNHNLGSVFAAHPSSSIAYGSEFRPVAHLEPLLSQHLYWPNLPCSCMAAHKVSSDLVHPMNGPPTSPSYTFITTTNLHPPTLVPNWQQISSTAMSTMSAPSLFGSTTLILLLGQNFAHLVMRSNIPLMIGGRSSINIEHATITPMLAHPANPLTSGLKRVHLSPVNMAIAYTKSSTMFISFDRSTLTPQ